MSEQNVVFDLDSTFSFAEAGIFCSAVLSVMTSTIEGCHVWPILTRNPCPRAPSSAGGPFQLPSFPSCSSANTHCPGKANSAHGGEHQGNEVTVDHATAVDEVGAGTEERGAAALVLAEIADHAQQDHPKAHAGVPEGPGAPGWTVGRHGEGANKELRRWLCCVWFALWEEHTFLVACL